MEVVFAFLYLCVILLKCVGWPSALVAVPWVVIFIPAIALVLLVLFCAIAVILGIIKIKK